MSKTAAKVAGAVSYAVAVAILVTANTRADECTTRDFPKNVPCGKNATPCDITFVEGGKCKQGLFLVEWFFGDFACDSKALLPGQDATSCVDGFIISPPLVLPDMIHCADTAKCVYVPASANEDATCKNGTRTPSYNQRKVSMPCRQDN